jgi:CHAT domain-containing protein
MTTRGSYQKGDLIQYPVLPAGLDSTPMSKKKLTQAIAIVVSFRMYSGRKFITMLFCSDGGFREIPYDNLHEHPQSSLLRRIGNL